MKTANFLFIALFICTAAFGTNPNPEKSETFDIQTLELKKLINNMFDQKVDPVKVNDQKIKIVIMNNEFKKVRVGEVDSMKEINSQSTLLPVIYRSEFVTRIDNVAYYVLKE